MSLIDQFEVQFNELSNSEILEGSLDEIQPVELAGVLQQEISRIQTSISPSEKVEEINISLSNHDYKRLKKYESLIIDGLENMLQKSAELKRIDAIKDTRVNIVQDSSLDKGLVKSIPNVKFESPLMETEEFVEITETRKFILEINGMKKSLEAGEYTLGRGTEVDIQIQDPGISRKHLVIIVEDKVIVKDLNSTNGTYINGERITEIEVEEQITFRVGVTEIRIASEIQ
jgi:hypothetical protein